MNFDYSKRRNSIRRVNTTSIVLIFIATISLIIYYSLSLFFIPQLYLSSSSEIKSQPVITGANLSASKVIVGERFDLTITAMNKGDTADMQVVYLSFPNITAIDRIVKILKYNFTQPVPIEIEDEIGSEYVGLDKVINASYPAIEANSRPWQTGDYYQISLEVEPSTVGRFVIVVKTIALPHINELNHYPRLDIKDYQGEFVAVSSVEVVNK